MLDVSNAINSYSTAKTGSIGALSKDDAKLKEKTDAFESVIVKQMLDIALDEKYSIFPDDAGKDIYKSMYTDTLANSVSGGFGYSKMLFDFLKRDLKFLCFLVDLGCELTIQTPVTKRKMIWSTHLISA